MDTHVNKLIELTGTSTQSFESALTDAISKAARTVRNMQWFQVVETQGSTENGEVTVWQVRVKIGFEGDR